MEWIKCKNCNSQNVIVQTDNIMVKENGPNKPPTFKGRNVNYFCGDCGVAWFEAPGHDSSILYGESRKL